MSKKKTNRIMVTLEKEFSFRGDISPDTLIETEKEEMLEIMAIMEAINMIKGVKVVFPIFKD